MASKVPLLQRFVKAVYAGNLDEAFTQLHPDMQLHEADGLPYAGTYHGADGFRELLGKVRALADLQIHHTEYLDAGDAVIARMDTTLTLHTSGQALDMPIVEIYRFTDDQISYVDVFYKDTNAVAQATN